MKNINVTQILNLFFDEVTDRSGKMLENYRHNERAFARSLLPSQTEVKARDVLQAGVALKATPGSLEVHPFVFRQVCSNGCIGGKATQSHKLQRVGDSTYKETTGKASEVIAHAEVEHWFRQAVDASCSDQAFADASKKFQSTLHYPMENPNCVNQALMSSLNYAGFPACKQLHAQIMREYLNHDEPTLFRLVNAVTAVARDLHDAEQKWNLESFGGELAWLMPSPSIVQGATAKALPMKERLVLA